MDLSALLPKVLQAVYETANGEVLASVDLESIAALLGASAKDVDSAVESLVRSGLLATPETGPMAELTERGILEYEDSARKSSDSAQSAAAYERIAERWRVLEWLYERSGGGPGEVVEEVGLQGLAPDRLNTVTSVLSYEGLIATFGFAVALTPEGVVAWERRADGRSIL